MANRDTLQPLLHILILPPLSPIVDVVAYHRRRRFTSVISFPTNPSAYLSWFSDTTSSVYSHEDGIYGGGWWIACKRTDVKIEFNRKKTYSWDLLDNWCRAY